MDELPVSCIHKESGCNLTLQRQLLAYHTKHECMFAQIKCCEEQCDQVFLKQDAEKHSAGCPHRLLKCKACDLSIKAKEMEVRNVHDSASLMEAELIGVKFLGT